MRTFVVFSMLLLQASASFFEAFSPVEETFGRLVTHVVTDVRDTIDCTLLAVENILSIGGMFGDNSQYREKCSGQQAAQTQAGYTQQSQYAYNVQEAVSEKTAKQEISEEIDESVSKASEHIKSILEHSNATQQIENVKNSLRNETERLILISEVLRKELYKLPEEVRKKFDFKADHQPTVEYLLDEIKLLYEVEQENKSSASANEVRHTFDEVLGILHVNDTGGALSDDEEVKEIIKYLGKMTNDSMIDVEKQVSEWSKEQKEQLKDIKEVVISTVNESQAKIDKIDDAVEKNKTEADVSKVINEKLDEIEKAQEKIIGFSDTLKDMAKNILDRVAISGIEKHGTTEKHQSTTDDPVTSVNDSVKIENDTNTATTESQLSVKPIDHSSTAEIDTQPESTTQPNILTSTQSTTTQTTQFSQSNVDSESIMKAPGLIETTTETVTTSLSSQTVSAPTDATEKTYLVKTTTEVVKSTISSNADKNLNFVNEEKNSITTENPKTSQPPQPLMQTPLPYLSSTQINPTTLKTTSQSNNPTAVSTPDVQIEVTTQNILQSSEQASPRANEDISTQSSVETTTPSNEKASAQTSVGVSTQSFVEITTVPNVQQSTVSSVDSNTLPNVQTNTQPAVAVTTQSYVLTSTQSSVEKISQPPYVNITTQLYEQTSTQSSAVTSTQSSVEATTETYLQASTQSSIVTSTQSYVQASTQSYQQTSTLPNVATSSQSNRQTSPQPYAQPSTESYEQTTPGNISTIVPPAQYNPQTNNAQTATQTVIASQSNSILQSNTTATQSLQSRTQMGSTMLQSLLNSQASFSAQLPKVDKASAYLSMLHKLFPPGTDDLLKSQNFKQNPVMKNPSQLSYPTNSVKQGTQVYPSIPSTVRPSVQNYPSQFQTTAQIHPPVQNVQRYSTQTNYNAQQYPRNYQNPVQQGAPAPAYTSTSYLSVPNTQAYNNQGAKTYPSYYPSQQGSKVFPSQQSYQSYNPSSQPSLKYPIPGTPSYHSQGNQAYNSRSAPMYSAQQGRPPLMGSVQQGFKSYPQNSQAYSSSYSKSSRYPQQSVQTYSSQSGSQAYASASTSRLSQSYPSAQAYATSYSS